MTRIDTDEIIRYPMRSKSEKPIFNYLVKSNMEMAYWLFQEFDDAVECAKTKGRELDDTMLIYDVYFNTRTRQFYAQKSFWIWEFDHKLNYDKHGDVELHIEFYLRAGEWMNPNQEWIDIIHRRWEKEDILASQMIEAEMGANKNDESSSTES